MSTRQNEGTCLVHELLERSAVKYPENIAAVYKDESITYKELEIRAKNTSVWLRERGLRKGERVAVMLENSIDYIIAYYGILKAGGIFVSLSTGLKPVSLKPVLDDIEPYAIICSKISYRAIKHTLLPEATKLLITSFPCYDSKEGECMMYCWDKIYTQDPGKNDGVSMDQESIASLIYTSGSTGKPKGVILTHKNLVSNTFSICEYLNLTSKDVQMVVLPFYYVMGKSLLNTHIAVGGKVVINNTFAYPATVLTDMERYGVTGFSGVPSTYAYLLHRSPLREYKERLSSLRYCTQAGGHMSSLIKKQLTEALPEHTEVVIMYGATEASARLTYLDSRYYTDKMGSIGKPIPGVSIRVVDETGKEVDNGSIGELVAQGENIMKGYWRDESSTSTVLSRLGYHTSDLGYRDEEGFLFITGRKDNMVKVGGHRINLQEIEDALMDTKLIVEAAVLDFEDPLMGKVMKGLVVPIDSSTSAQEIMAKISQNIPAYKIPVEIVITERLPKKDNGKVDRGGCRKIMQRLQPE